jgi:uncharacterized membrane protein
VRRLVTYFLQGLLLVVPMAATAYALVAAFTLIDNLIPVRIPGLGFVLILVVIAFLGWLSPYVLANPLAAWLERLLERVPLVKVVYTALRDLMSAFVGEKKRFTEPVLVLVGRESGLQKLGFVTKKDLTSLGLEGKVAVYLPHSYNFSGNLFIVPRENVTPLPVNPADAMKFIVSGGVTEL